MTCDLRQGLVTTWTARRLSVLTASLVPGLCLGCVPLLEDTAAVVAVTSLALACYGSMFTGVFSNHADLAPSIAGTLMAVTNTAATLPGEPSLLKASTITLFSEYCVPRHLDISTTGVLIPPAVGLLLAGPGPELATWHAVFLATAAVLALEAAVFCGLGSADLQPWGEAREENVDTDRSNDY